MPMRIRSFPTQAEREASLSLAQSDHVSSVQSACRRLLGVVLFEGAVIAVLAVLLVRKFSS